MVDCMTGADEEQGVQIAVTFGYVVVLVIGICIGVVIGIFI